MIQFLGNDKQQVIADGNPYLCKDRRENTVFPIGITSLNGISTISNRTKIISKNLQTAITNCMPTNYKPFDIFLWTVVISLKKTIAKLFYEKGV